VIIKGIGFAKLLDMFFEEYSQIILVGMLAQRVKKNSQLLWQ